VKHRHWLRTTFVLSAASVAAALPPVRSLAQPAQTQREVAQREFEQLKATLNNPGKPPRERDEAAKRLLQRGANDVLLDVLQSGNTELQVSVARALSEPENPPPQFLDGLLRCLQPQTTSELASAASQALLNYHDNPAARARLREFIQSVIVGESSRVAAVLALGSLNDKETAQFLMQVLRGDNQLLSDAAADALAEMTGLSEKGRDVGQWEIWWQDQQGKTPEQFLAERRAGRETSTRALRERLALAAKAIDTFVEDYHRPIKDNAERAAYVLRCLNDPSPDFRAAGARLVDIELKANLTVDDKVLARLRDLIGDSSPDVRLRVANAIAAVNDPPSAKPLLAQLQREKIPDVKEKLIQAIAPIKDITAATELIRQLDDPAFKVSEAAAKALADLGPEIAKNPLLERDVANTLTFRLGQTAGVRGANKLRENLVLAMIPLRDPVLERALSPLLIERAGNTPNVRRNAIRALSAINVESLKAGIAGSLANSLRYDSDSGVRLEAASALGLVGTPAQSDALYTAMGSREPDSAIRAAAWTSLNTVLEQEDLVRLALWSETFKQSPERQLAVERIRQKKLIDASPAHADDLAVVEENIGNLFLNPAIDKPEQAISHLAAALKHWDAGTGHVTEGLQNSLMYAFLRARQYKEAVAFATERIMRNDQNQETMARAILQEVDRLSRAKQYTAALDLLTEAKNLPIKSGYYPERFKEREGELRRNGAYVDWWVGVVA
jgi:HEAT repeat protein